MSTKLMRPLVVATVTIAIVVVLAQYRQRGLSVSSVTSRIIQQIGAVKLLQSQVNSTSEHQHHILPTNKPTHISNETTEVTELSHNLTEFTPSSSVTPPLPKTDNIAFLNTFTDSSYITDKFTIVMPTFKRTENLYLVMDKYCDFTDILDRIVILWNNIGTSVPQEVKSRAQQCNVPVWIRVMEINNLTSRFYPYSQIKTAGVMSLDDDNLIDKSTLELAFRTFQKYPYKVIGYDSRGFAKQNGQYQYSFKSYPYTIILTNRAIVHYKYLQLFSHIPKQLTDFVIKNKNGEDLIMNVIVGKYLKENGIEQCVGIRVNTKVKALNNFSKEHYGGLSRRPSHIKDRHKCLQLLGDTYGDLQQYLPTCTLVINELGDIK